MKKLLTFIVICLFGITSCVEEKYHDKEITTLVFIKENTFSGYYQEQLYNLEENTFFVKTIKMFHLRDESDNEDFIFACSFSEEEEKQFIASLKKANIYALKSKYTPIFQVTDGSSWQLIITFSDYTEFRSEGYERKPNNANVINQIAENFSGYKFF